MRETFVKYYNSHYKAKRLALDKMVAATDDTEILKFAKEYILACENYKKLYRICCPQCSGSGRVEAGNGQEKPCEECKGTGIYIKKPTEDKSWMSESLVREWAEPHAAAIIEALSK